jgi:uridine kinase
VSRTSRAELLDTLAGAVARLALPHPTRVAVDGPDAAGKTVLADELTGKLRSLGRDVVRASIDGFHRSRAERHRRGELSPEGYYEDSFDLDAFRERLLEPLGPHGSRVFRAELFDHAADAPCPGSLRSAHPDTVLVVDGVFLLRPELDGYWDLRIHVTVADDEILRRARERDAALFGSASRAEERYRKRYLPAQRLYEKQVRPAERADFVLLNDDPADPILVVPEGLTLTAGPEGTRVV